MNEFEAYAAQRAQDLTAADDALRPAVRQALEQHGTEGWYDPILNEAEALFGMVYSDEDGDPDLLDAHLTTFVDDLGEALAKTTSPTDPVEDAQVERITTWVATYTANAATAATLDADEKVVWTSMRDSGVRDTHRIADGQVRTVGQTFDVGGAALRFPGDPLGPLEETLGCRCLLLREGGTTMARQFALTEEPDAPPPVEEMPDGEPSDFEYTAPRWHGVLAPEGVASGDGRTFALESLTARDLPIPLRWVRADVGFHDGAIVVGNIQSIWRDGGLIKGEGDFRTDIPEANEVVGMVATDMLRGVSVDLDDIAFEVDTTDPEAMEQAIVLTKGRISAATLVDIPAFAEAWIALGGWAEGELTDSASLIASCGCWGAPAEAAAMPEEDNGPEFGPGDKVRWGDGMTGVVQSVDGDIATVVADDTEVPEQVPVADLEHDDEMEFAAFREVDTKERKDLADEGKAMPDGSFPIANCDDLHNAIQAIGRAKDPDAVKAHIKKRASALSCGEDVIPEDWAAVTQTFAPGTKDGPGWLTNPRDTQRLRNYWTKGEGAAKIRWGTPGDFDRCRTQMSEYVSPLFLAGTCANMHKEALGVWPGQEGTGVSAAETESFTLVSSAAPTLPREWFSNPHLDGPTPIQVTEDGRVFGHLATWGTCHIGMSGVCTTPPTSASRYAHFTTGEVHTDGGPVPVGQITMDTGHASLDAGSRATVAHYDNTGLTVADVAAGEDEHGIWLAGALREDVPEAKVRALRAAALSGDWRRIGGALELVAALAVNVPGFPIPRTALAASAGEQTALVAAGVAPPEVEVEQPDMVAMVRAAMEQIDRERSREVAVAQARATLREARIKRARAALRAKG